MRHVPGFDQGWRGYEGKGWDGGHYKETFMAP